MQRDNSQPQQQQLPGTTQQAAQQVQQQPPVSSTPQTPSNQPVDEQLQAYQRKWDEELEGFKKLAARLQVQAAACQQGLLAQGCSPPGLHHQPGQQLVHYSQSSSSNNSGPDQLTAAIHQAEALLAEVHAAAVQSLSSGAAADNKLLAKQLRLQRNQAFEAAKALLLKAQATGTA